MPEEHTGQAGFEYAWKELLTRSRQTGQAIVHVSAAYLIEFRREICNVQHVTVRQRDV